jgi:hypothetical protein
MKKMMQILRCKLLVALLMVLACGCAARQGGSGAGPGTEGPGEGAASKVVDLRYAWVAGMVATLELERTRLVVEDGRTVRRARGVMSAELSTSEDQDGLLLSFDELRISSLELKDTAERPEVLDGAERAEVAAEVGALLPSFVLAPNGEPLRVVEGEALLSRVLATLQEYAGDVVDEDLQVLQSRVEPLVSGPLLEHMVKNDWRSMVLDWDGRSLELGVMEKSRDVVDLPMFRSPLTAEVKLGVEERLPCPGDEARSCVRLKKVTRPDREASASMMADVLDSLGPLLQEKARAALVAELEIFRAESAVNRVEIVTDPQGLVPYSYKVVKESVFRAEDANGVPHQLRKEDTVLQTFVWRHR